MPFDGGARWMLEIAAADKTAAAFDSVDRRMKGLQNSQAQMANAMGAVSSGAAAVGKRLVGLAAAYLSVEAAHRLFETGLKAGDLGEQAEQLGVNTDQLQGYRLAAAQAGVTAESLDAALMKLAKAAGTANDGNDEMIARFSKLGVKLLDVKGQLRPVSDLMPEVARGILEINSPTERAAMTMELFGRSGARMQTVLKDLAEGNDKLVDSARKQNALISPETIAAWDELGDKLLVGVQRYETMVATLGKPVALGGLQFLNSQLMVLTAGIKGFSAAWDLAKGAFETSSADLIVRRDTIEASIANLKDSTDALDVAKLSGYRQELQRINDTLASRANIVTLPTTTVTASSLGAGQPVGKAAAKAGDDQAKAYAKIVDGAKQYIALKDVETRSLGVNADAAANLKHQQELQGKATAANLALGPPQIAQLDALAAAMAKADATFASAKFMDDAVTKSKEFTAAQEIEQQTLFMSTEAAAAYRIEKQLTNEATLKGIALTGEQVAKIRELAGVQAAAGAKTRQMIEMVDLGKDSFKGFFSDIRQGAREGAEAFQVLENAGLNALDRISDKLTDMAIDDLWNAAFGGSKGAGSGAAGGLFSGIGGWLGGLFGGGGGFGSNGFGAGMLSGTGGIYAKGGAFDRGNVIPFARGDVFSSPTMFGLAGNRMGVMAEAGPEAIVPLHRGRDGGLGVRMAGGGGQQQPQRIEIVLVDDLLAARIADGANVQIVRAATAIEGRAVKRSTRLAPAAVAQHPLEREGEWRTAGAG